jgi:hypothetical protein
LFMKTTSTSFLHFIVILFSSDTVQVFVESGPVLSILQLVSAAAATPNIKVDDARTDVRLKTILLILIPSYFPKKVSLLQG